MDNLHLQGTLTHERLTARAITTRTEQRRKNYPMLAVIVLILAVGYAFLMFSGSLINALFPPEIAPFAYIVIYGLWLGSSIWGAVYLPKIWKKRFDTIWVHEQRATPVTLALNAAHSRPTLTWTFDHDAADITDKATSKRRPRGLSLPQNLPVPSGALTWDDGAVNLDVTQDPDDASVLYLLLRGGHSKQQLCVQLDADLWGHNPHLPKMKREAITLDRPDQRALVTSILQIAQLTGAHVPAFLQQTVASNA